MATKYFVKHTKVHKYPVPKSCNVIHENQTLYDSKEEALKHAKEYCDRCFTELPK